MNDHKKSKPPRTDDDTQSEEVDREIEELSRETLQYADDGDGEDQVHARLLEGETSSENEDSTSKKAHKSMMHEILEDEILEDEIPHPAQRTRKDSRVSFLNASFEPTIESIPHDLFIQLNELTLVNETLEWRETARWIRYEETVQQEADRFGQPHVASLSFNSLLNARRSITNCVLMLDLEETEYPHIIFRAVEAMTRAHLIRKEDRENVFKTILLHHNSDNLKLVINVDANKIFGSNQSMHSDRSDFDHHKHGHLLRTPRPSSGSIKGLKGLNIRRRSSGVLHPSKTGLLNPRMIFGKDKHMGNLDLKLSMNYLDQVVQNESLMKLLPPDCEGVAIMTGMVEFLEQPTLAFIRLAEATRIPNILEVAVPVRFLIILLGPKSRDLDYHETGRSFGTLMSNKRFREKAYHAQDRHDLTMAISEYLEESIVLSPDRIVDENVFSFDMMKLNADKIKQRRRSRSSKTESLDEKKLIMLEEKFEEDKRKDPLRKTGYPFGGVINDFKRRMPLYKSDITDGLNVATVSTTLFMYFANFATAVTFGGLIGYMTNGEMGTSETIVSACFVGCIFHLLCCQPLVIIGVTGPLIIFDRALYGFCIQQGYDFLNVRLYIGAWMIVISVVVAAFDGSVYVRYFTRFTQEIFSALTTVIYLQATFLKAVALFVKNPMVTHPNTAFLSLILMIGTFTLAYSLRMFKTTKYITKRIREFLGNFCSPISITIFVILANLMPDVETERLDIPNGIKPTQDRSWIVPLWKDDNPIWLPIVCVIPAFLVFILIFIESQISQLFLANPERKTKKGSGFHWDIVLLIILNAICGLLGCPWQVAAQMRSVAHVNTVTVMSTNNPPGVSPHVVDVKEQRVSGFVFSLLCGLSLFAAPILQKVPISVLFGVFLYLGICSITGVQLFDRVFLFFLPSKYHPLLPYTTKVSPLRMHIFTAIQVAAILLLWIVYESPVALFFPFVLMMMLPLRNALKRWYTEAELQALDGVPPKKEENDEDNGKEKRALA